jgi:cytochrome c553
MCLRTSFLTTIVMAALTSAPCWAADAGPESRGDAAKGKAIATTVCAACHGPDGNSVMPANPTLAGQHEKYTEKQLANFKDQLRKNPIMLGMVAALTPEDMRNVGAYFAAQKPAPNVARDEAAVKIGERIYRGGVAESGVPACSGCHGPDASGIPNQYPRLAGQHKDYTVAQLKTFRSGERANDSANMMRMVAGRLSDEQINGLAEYVAGLH